MKHKILLFLPLCFISFFALNAQSDSLNATKPAYHRKSAVALFGGLPGVGVEYAYNVNKHINLRARGAYFKISDLLIPYTIDGRDLDVYVNADALNFDALFEYLPFSGSSFKLVGGLSYVNNIGGNAVILMKENTMFGEVELSPEQVGQMDIALNYTGLAPYGGLGFGRAVPKRRVGFGLEIGTYYLGPPEVKLTATNLLEPTANEDQEKALQNAFDSFRWMPVALLKLTVKLN